MKKIRLIVLILILPVVLPLFACNRLKTAKIDAYVFGSLTCTAQFYSYSLDMDIVKERVTARFMEIDNAVNTTKSAMGSESEIYLFNKSTSTDKFRISKTFYDLLIICERYYGADGTDGYFDPAVYPLVKLWGMSSTDINDDDYVFSPPSVAAVEALMPYCKFDTAVEYGIDGSGYYVKKNFPGVMLDFGGVAKGYAADEAVRIAKENGADHAIVNISGNYIMLGKKYDGKLWRIGIDSPRAAEDNYKSLALLNLENVSAVASGDYVRYYNYNGVRFAHIINPKTGLPANIYYNEDNGSYTNINPETGVYDGVALSAIINKSSTLCDIYSTYTLIIGLEKAADILRNKNIKGIIVTNDKKMAIIGEHSIFEHTDYDAYKYYNIITDDSYGRFIQN